MQLRSKHVQVALHGAQPLAGWPPAADAMCGEWVRHTWHTHAIPGTCAWDGMASWRSANAAPGGGRHGGRTRRRGAHRGRGRLGQQVDQHRGGLVPAEHLAVGHRLEPQPVSGLPQDGAHLQQPPRSVPLPLQLLVARMVLMVLMVLLLMMLKLLMLSSCSR
jgi:hypothetical protein